MIKADVPQDVTEYKEQFFFGMNSRQLICSVLMIVIAVLVFLVGSKFISTDILVYITIALIAPLAAVGFLKYNGMGFEKIAATVAEFYVSNQRRRMEYLPDEIVNQKNALIDAMNNAISTAISNAMPAALAEYNALMASLDDTLTAETHRQHYETEQQSVPNNNADSAEFTGMPVVGTNHFGNVEINSELSAEELLAYIALYKSMSIINPDDSDPDAEQILNITSQDIMDFFEETEFITITTDVTHGNFCSGMNCKRRLVDEVWEYYCDGDHDNLSGEIGACKTADELREKVMELTDAESNGVDEDSFNKLIEEYMKLIEKELDITEADYRKFGAADNTKAQEFYSILIGDEEIPNNFWNIETPIGEEDSDE